MEILAVIFLLVFGLTGILIYSTFTWGLVCFKFWSWFVVPIFISAWPEIPVLTFLEACGLMFFISLFRNPGGNNIKKEYRDEGTNWGNLLITPWLVLLVGWAFKAICI